MTYSNKRGMEYLKIWTVKDYTQRHESTPDFFARKEIYVLHFLINTLVYHNILLVSYKLKLILINTSVSGALRRHDDANLEDATVG